MNVSVQWATSFLVAPCIRCVLDFKSQISNPKSQVPNPQSRLGNLQSAIRNPHSAKGSTQSAIRNPQSAIRNPRSLPWLVILVVAPLVVFWPVTTYDFVNFDDPEYVYENPSVAQGLTPGSFAAAWREFVSAHWHPITMLSYMADSEFFGLNAPMFHVTNLFIHMLNGVLLFLALEALTRNRQASALVALLFSLHPLHVESVAWISARKDLLSGFFAFAALWAYAGYARSPSPPRFLLVASAVGLGLLAKSVLVTLPFALLLLDYWPLERFRLRDIKDPEHRTKFVAIAGEKFVLLLMALPVLFMDYLAQRDAGQVGTARFSWMDRAGNAFVSYAHYLADTFRPTGLAVYYPLPSGGHSPALLEVSVTVILLITAAVLLAFSRAPYLFVGWFWFVGVLIPNAGFVQLGAQAFADRYTYIPLIGVFVMAVWLMFDLFERRGAPVRWAIYLVILCLIPLTAITRAQLRHWENTETLFSRAIAVTGENWLAHYNLGVHYEQFNRVNLAEEHYRAALEALPTHAPSHNNFGALLARRGEPGQAIDHFQRALESDPENVTALANLATALIDSGRTDEAAPYVQKALQLAPDSPRARQAAKYLDQSR